GDVGDPSGEELEVLLLLGTPDVGDGHAGEQAGGDELGVVVEELVEAVDDVHAAGDAVEQEHTLGGREQPVRRGDTADDAVGDGSGVCDGLGQVGQHGDPVGRAVEERAGIDAG